jgi:hypothetical protein
LIYNTSARSEQSPKQGRLRRQKRKVFRVLEYIV